MFALTNRSFRRELRRSLEGCRFRLSLNIDLFEEGYCLDFFGFLIPLLFLDRWRREPHEIMESWGIKHFERSLHLTWGRHCKVIRLPWDWHYVKSANKVLRPDGTWVLRTESYDRLNGKEYVPDGRWTETYPYRYTLKSGEVQYRNATIYVERCEWRWRMLKWMPFFAKKRQYIDVKFNDEVGERTGTWKGGCIGCGYEMRNGESPLDTLRRMERERKF